MLCRVAWRKTKFLCAAVFLCLLFGGIGARAAWGDEWKKTLQAAREEGQVTVYIYRFDRVLDAFKRDYPDIRVVSVTGRGSQLSARIMAERRAGKYLPDIYSGGVSSHVNILYRAKVLDPMRPLLTVPEVVDKSKWYEQRHSYVDPERKYIFAYIANPYSAQLHYNSNLVNPKEIESYWDILDNKWKGNILSLDPTLTGIWGPLRLFYYHPKLGPTYLKKLFGEMQIKVGRSDRQLTDWLAQGKSALCFGCKDTPRAKSQGLPVDSFITSDWKEGGAITASPGTISLVNRAPHPNAAKVFINWFLSPNGQMAVQKLGYPSDPPNSRRVDIPKDELPSYNRIIKGTKYFDVSDPAFSNMKPILKLINETRHGKK